MEMFVKMFDLIKGVKNKIPKTVIAIKNMSIAIRGRYCSLIFTFRKNNLTNVETAVITMKTEIPKTGPIAKNTIDKAAGKKIPNPRSPIKCLAAAMSVAIPGSSSSKTIVFGGTPALTDCFTECFKKLPIPEFSSL